MFPISLLLGHQSELQCTVHSVQVFLIFRGQVQQGGLIYIKYYRMEKQIVRFMPNSNRRKLQFFKIRTYFLILIMRFPLSTYIFTYSTVYSLHKSYLVLKNCRLLLIQKRHYLVTNVVRSEVKQMFSLFNLLTCVLAYILLL